MKKKKKIPDLPLIKSNKKAVSTDNSTSYNRKVVHNVKSSGKPYGSVITPKKRAPVTPKNKLK